MVEALEALKEQLLAIELTPLPKDGEETAQEKRQSTTEALRRKFTLLNNRELNSTQP